MVLHTDYIIAGEQIALTGKELWGYDLLFSYYRRKMKCLKY